MSLTSRMTSTTRSNNFNREEEEEEEDDYHRDPERGVRTTRINELTTDDYVNMVIKAVRELSNGFGSSDTDIIRWIQNTHGAIDPELVESAIRQGIEDGDFVRLFDSRGPIAHSFTVTSIIDVMDFSYEPIDVVVDNIMDEHPYLITGQSGAEKILHNIRLMVELGYIQANDKLSIRPVPNLIYNEEDMDYNGKGEGEGKKATSTNNWSNMRQSLTVEKTRSSYDDVDSSVSSRNYPTDSSKISVTVPSPHLPSPQPSSFSNPNPVVSSTSKRPSREPSPYNRFMKDEIARVKETQPKLDHKEAFKVSAANWKTSKENPKRQNESELQRSRLPREPVVPRQQLTSASSSSSSTLKVREPSPHNKFLPEEMARVNETQPDLSYVQTFKQASANWADSSENPKRKPNQTSLNPSTTTSLRRTSPSSPYIQSGSGQGESYVDPHLY